MLQLTIGRFIEILQGLDPGLSVMFQEYDPLSGVSYNAPYRDSMRDRSKKEPYQEIRMMLSAQPCSSLNLEEFRKLMMAHSSKKMREAAQQKAPHDGGA